MERNEFDCYDKDNLSVVAAKTVRTSVAKTTVDTMQTTQELAKEELLKTIKELQSVVKALDSDFNSQQEQKLKKVVAAAAVVAKHAGTLPKQMEPKKMNPVAIASVADEGVNKLKTAYKVGSGQMTADEAIDKLVDYGAARVTSAIDKAVPAIKEAADKLVEKATPIIVNTACNAVEKVFPPAKVITPVVRSATPYITEKAKTYVRKGIDIVASYTKKAVKVVAEKVKSTVKSVAKSVCSFFGF